MRRLTAIVLTIILVATVAIQLQAQRRDILGALTVSSGSGTPTSTAEPDGSLYVDTATGRVWSSSSAAWTPLTHSGTAALTVTLTAGTTTLIPAAPLARTVLVTVTVVTALANGDGAQPTFAIGQTSSTSKFAATSAFTSASAGTTKTYGGTLSANTALLVTQVAGTGATETGAVTVTAIATP